LAAERQLIIDWADTDEAGYDCNVNPNGSAGSSTGVEDAYYQLLATKPFRRKNAPYDSLDELCVGLRELATTIIDVVLKSDADATAQQERLDRRVVLRRSNSER